LQAFIPRNLSEHIREIAGFFPVVSLTGPRQAGKTTLLKELFTHYRYVSFEDPAQRALFEDDPYSFLARYDGEVIFDEAQRVPKLFSYLQTVVDNDRRPGRFIVSGSQNFLLSEKISQSLAGRVGIVRLFPLDFTELASIDQLGRSPAAMIYRGYYPQLYQTDLPPRFFYPNYLSTYLDRDVTHLVKKGSMQDFRRFVALCAAEVGQTISYSSLAKKLQLSVPTIKNWLHHLERSDLAFTLSPYFENFGKRLIKAPKLYFYDTGLVCYLLDIGSPEEVQRNRLYGALFENLVVAEMYKQRMHAGAYRPLYFFRDSHQNEVDLIERVGDQIVLTEIKSSATYQRKMAKTIEQLAAISPGERVKKRLVYGGDTSMQVGDLEVVSWRDLSERPRSSPRE
jgi:predicted AAA+ superfamily ATPase